jgi:hypothetical protein
MPGKRAAQTNARDLAWIRKALGIGTGPTVTSPEDVVAAGKSAVNLQGVLVGAHQLAEQLGAFSKAQQTRKLSGAGLSWTFSNNTFAVVDPNITEVQQLQDLAALVVSMDSTEDNLIPEVDSANVDLYLDSVQCRFAAIPFTVIAETGTTIATTEYNTKAPSVAAEAGLSGQHYKVRYFQPLISEQSYSNGSPVYQIRKAFDITKDAKAWCAENNKRKLREEDSLAFLLGMVVCFPTHTLVVNSNHMITMVHHLKERRLADT